MVLQSSRLGLYQKWLRTAYNKIETLYYNQVDDLMEKMDDLELPNIPALDFELQNFSFISQWEQGMISSKEVHRILTVMNFESAAKSKITKRLVNYMMNHEQLTHYLKPVIANLNGECVEEMIKFLGTLEKLFSKMMQIDKEQIPVTMIQQKFSGLEFKLYHEEMPLNQAIKHIECFIDKDAYQRFYMSDQIVIFDEDIGNDKDRLIHYIFAPRVYIELFKCLFNIKDSLAGEVEEKHIKTLIESYVSNA